ncbi:MAG: AAA family ATPase [Nitrososphaeria archaeon]
MRISRIILKNYRQYKQCEITFNKNKENDLHIIIGPGGMGKTNLLNAINWCLYGEEPHLSQSSSQLPILNLNTIESSDDLQAQDTKVEIYVNLDDRRSILFSRKITFMIYKKTKQEIVKQVENFDAIIKNEKGNAEIYSNDAAKKYVEQLFPNRIREFFFFDGERLDKYFKEATGQHIRNTIFQISQLDLLEKVEKKIENIYSDLRRDARRLNPRIEDLVKLIEKEENDRKELQEHYERCQEDIRQTKLKIEEYEEKLRGMPNVSELEKRREEYEEIKKKRENDYEEKNREKNNMIFEYAVKFYLSPVLKNALDIILQKRENKEIPPPVNKSLLEESLNKKICIICNRNLDALAQENVLKLLSEIQYTSEISDTLLQMEPFIIGYKEDLFNFNDKIKKINQELNYIKKDIEEFSKKITEINNQISGYNVEEIKLWNTNLNDYKDRLEKLNQQIGYLRSLLVTADNRIKKLKNDLDEELKKEEQFNKIRKAIQLCERIQVILKKCKESVMDSIRKEIEENTKKYFFDLIWKKETFKDVVLDKDYTLKLYHALGYECLGSTSASERELLALSFTLALHCVSGFDAPIIIDTPVARISTEMRENFAKIFSEISKSKQIILLFTTSEFSSEVSKHLDPCASNRFRLIHGTNEYETKLEMI